MTNRITIGRKKWACNDHLSLLADKDMIGECPEPTEGGAGIITPAGGGRFLGRGTWLHWPGPVKRPILAQGEAVITEHMLLLLQMVMKAD